MNSFGRLFRVTTFGESHGPAIGCVIDGCPPGLRLDLEAMRFQLSRRATGTSRHTSQRREPDEVQVLSGLFEGHTTGTPLALLIFNKDARSKDYTDIAQKFRPGHADLTYHRKYGLRDYRGGGRSSARETTMRVAAGAVARQWLAEQGVQVRGCLQALGPHRLAISDWSSVDDNPFFCAEPSKVAELEAAMDALRKSGDSLGAEVYAEARGVPVGLGSPVYARLDADIAAAMMSINAAKGVSIGAGFASVAQRGTEHRDEMTSAGFLSNNAGGVLGGISTGQPVTVHVAFKPTSSIRLPGRTIDQSGEETEIVTKGRHDPCVGIRATPIVEAMLALVLMDHVLLDRAQCGDVKR